ncbi:chemotaxis protein CheB [Sphingomonas sp. LHG3406-1]|uniref:chemotaxis protein CheB n=1 Tax=Sphingomonas sp. LHG3406-1 TaxID=2804617 RepID=UPI00261CBCD3|nr:chemotaxis protein CheB [Sphingomonas sp. LHG3406-1]
MGPALAIRKAAPSSLAPRPIRLMIVDDSMVARAVLSRMVELGGGFEISAVAGTAEDAIEALAHVTVDVILLDLEMPGAGGLDKLPEIIAKARGARVLIVSSLAEEGAAATVKALADGAADTLLKPGTGRFQGRFADVLVTKIRALGQVECTGDPNRPTLPAPLQAMATEALSLIAIGASTGGIHALGRFFGALPEATGAPILVTQHLPVPFMDVFARQLSTAAKRPARIATEGALLVADEIMIAPGDAHLTVARANDRQLRIRLTGGRSNSGCLPSVDPMLDSIAKLKLPGAVAVILSGMGRDGVTGAEALVRAGGSVLVQDEPTSAVWGMPRAVAEAGLAAAILPPEKLARRVASRIGQTHADK